MFRQEHRLTWPMFQFASTNKWSWSANKQGNTITRMSFEDKRNFNNIAWKKLRTITMSGRRMLAFTSISWIFYFRECSNQNAEIGSLINTVNRTFLRRESNKGVSIAARMLKCSKNARDLEIIGRTWTCLTESRSKTLLVVYLTDSAECNHSGTLWNLTYSLNVL